MNLELMPPGGTDVSKSDPDREFGRSFIPHGNGHALDYGKSHPVERRASED